MSQKGSLIEVSQTSNNTHFICILLQQNSYIILLVNTGKCFIIVTEKHLMNISFFFSTPVYEAQYQFALIAITNTIGVRKSVLPPALIIRGKLIVWCHRGIDYSPSHFVVSRPWKCNNANAGALLRIIAREEYYYCGFQVLNVH